MEEQKTLILGASSKPDRYAYMAANRLKSHGHEIVQVGNREGEVAGEVIHTETLPFEGIETITLYLGPKNQIDYYNYMVELAPKRVIFNPGTWNPELVELLKRNKIEVLEACTLVMLAADTY